MTGFLSAVVPCNTGSVKKYMYVVLQEEEMRRAAEEKQRLEDEEAAKWMNMISVQDTVGAAGRGGKQQPFDMGQDQALRDKHSHVHAPYLDVTPCLSMAMDVR